jgi:hypothetical protein
MRKGILFLALLALAPVLKAQDTFQLTVLAYQWTTTHNTMTFTWPGQANTSCSGNTNMNGYVSSGGNISANGVSSSTCSTSYTPPSNQTIDVQKPVIFIVATTNTSRMILTCTRNVRWSQCHALNPGQFIGRIEKGHFEVQALFGKGKEEWVRFDVVEQTAISPQQSDTNRVQQAQATTAETAGATNPAAATIEPPQSPDSSANMGFPSRWKSMQSGTVRTLRFEAVYIYGEVVLTDAAAKAGAFTLMEFKKDGDKYVGKSNSHFLRNDLGAACSKEFQMELTLVTPERIAGRMLAPTPDAIVDWKTCQFSAGPQWQSFTWIPVK